MPFDPKVHVGTSAILTREGVEGREVLLLKRAAHATHGANTWGLPGGWIDWGQTGPEAAAREVYEEVGLLVDPAQAIPRGSVANTYPEEDMHVICLNYEFQEFSGELTNMEPEKATALEWIPLSRLKDIPLFPPLESLALELGWLSY